ncbi:MAG: antitermination protein NusB, partial [Eggerthellaceae bacterium]|nr:antitermination protein NusB [Eggerthellaceae bacterium]
VRKYGSQLDDYVTVDNLEFKTKVLAERAKKCGLQVSETLTADALHLSDALGDRTFDAVFVDAPCSGFGTLRRHPEIRWKAKEEDVEAMEKQGLDLLRQAALHVDPGGTLAYATGTVTHEENNAVVRRFLRSEEGADFALAPLRGKGCFSTRLVPDGPDAHFAVRFVRNS